MADTKNATRNETDEHDQIRELSQRETEKVQGGIHFRIYELPPVKFGLKEDYNGSGNSI